MRVLIVADEPHLAEAVRDGLRLEAIAADRIGLGPAIVQSVVRAHDGTLNLVPGPAGGLVVTVPLPAVASGHPLR